MGLLNRRQKVRYIKNVTSEVRLCFLFLYFPFHFHANLVKVFRKPCNLWIVNELSNVLAKEKPFKIPSKIIQDRRLKEEFTSINPQLLLKNLLNKQRVEWESVFGRVEKKI